MNDALQEELERRILEEALVSPRAALMQLTLEIDREMRKLLVSTGALGRYIALASPTLPNALRILASVQGARVPEELQERIAEFWTLRNIAAAHQPGDIPLAAFQLGLSILR